jgi:hypothetical protein
MLLWWTSTMTHPSSLSWRMIPFPQHPKLTFVLVQARGYGYGWLLSHLFVCFTSYILLSLQHCIFALFWFNLWHPIFSHFVIRDMHLSFESMAITGTPCLRVYLMDIHHDTSFMFILKNDSICSTSKARIHFCLGKGVGLWLLTSHLFVCFASHILFSLQCCVFVSVWFSLPHLVFSHVNVDTCWMHVARI